MRTSYASASQSITERTPSLFSNAETPSTATTCSSHQPALDTSYNNHSPPLPAFISPTVSSESYDRSSPAVSAFTNGISAPADPIATGRRDCPPHASPHKSLAVPLSPLAPTTSFNVSPTLLDASSGSNEVSGGRDPERRLPDINLQSSIDASKTGLSGPDDKNVYDYDVRMATYSEANPDEVLALESSTAPCIAPVPPIKTSSIAHTMNMLAIAPPLFTPLKQSFPPRSIAVAPSANSPVTTSSGTSRSLQPGFGSNRAFKDSGIGQRRLPNVPLQSVVDASKAAAASVHDKNTHIYTNGKSSHSRARPVELLPVASSLSPSEEPVPSVQPPSVAYYTNTPSITPSLPRRPAFSNIHPNRPNAMSVMDSAPAPTTMCSVLSPAIRKRKFGDQIPADSRLTRTDEHCDKRQAIATDHPLPSSTSTGHDSPMMLDQKPLNEDCEPRQRGHRGRGGRGRKIPAFMSSDDQTHHALAQRGSQAETIN